MVYNSFCMPSNLNHPLSLLSFCQVLGRPGFSIADKKQKTGRIGFRHRIRKEEAMRWFQQKVRLGLSYALTDYVWFL